MKKVENNEWKAVRKKIKKLSITCDLDYSYQGTVSKVYVSVIWAAKERWGVNEIRWGKINDNCERKDRKTFVADRFIYSEGGRKERREEDWEHGNGEGKREREKKTGIEVKESKLILHD